MLLNELAADPLPLPEASNTPSTFLTGIASDRRTLGGGGGNMSDVVAVMYRSRYFKFASVDLKSITCNNCEFINYVSLVKSLLKPVRYPYLVETLHNRSDADLHQKDTKGI